MCGTEGHHSCSSGPSVVVSGGRFVWCCEVGWGLYLLRGQPEWGGDEQRRGGESLRCPPWAARLVATRPTPVGDRQLPDGPSASHTPPSGSAAGSAPPAQLSGGSSRQPGRCGHLPAVTPAVAPAVRSPGALGGRGECSGPRRCALRRQAARAERPQSSGPSSWLRFRARARIDEPARESIAIVKRFACPFAKKLARRYVRCAPNSGVAWGF